MSCLRLYPMADTTYMSSVFPKCSSLTAMWCWASEADLIMVVLKWLQPEQRKQCDPSLEVKENRLLGLYHKPRFTKLSTNEFLGDIFWYWMWHAPNSVWATEDSSPSLDWAGVFLKLTHAVRKIHRLSSVFLNQEQALSPKVEGLNSYL